MLLFNCSAVRPFNNELAYAATPVHVALNSGAYLCFAFVQAAASLRLTLAEKQDTLKQLVDEGWLAKTPDQAGAFSIGVRSFLELGSYLASFDLPERTQRVWSKFL